MAKWECGGMMAVVVWGEVKASSTGPLGRVNFRAGKSAVEVRGGDMMVLWWG